MIDPSPTDLPKLKKGRRSSVTSTTTSKRKLRRGSTGSKSLLETVRPLPKEKKMFMHLNISNADVERLAEIQEKVISKYDNLFQSEDLMAVTEPHFSVHPVDSLRPLSKNKKLAEKLKVGVPPALSGEQEEDMLATYKALIGELFAIVRQVPCLLETIIAEGFERDGTLGKSSISLDHYKPHVLNKRSMNQKQLFNYHRSFSA